MNTIQKIKKAIEDTVLDDQNRFSVYDTDMSTIVETDDISVATGILSEIAEQVYNYYCADEGEFNLNFNIKPNKITFKLYFK